MSMFLGCKRSQCASQLASEFILQLSPTVAAYSVCGMIHPMSKATITVYGIPNCDSVKKARVWLTDHGVDYVFHDFKKQGVPPEAVDVWLKHVSWDVLVNRKGTTWRKLDPALQASVVDGTSARALMLAHASVVKRPVVVKGTHVIVGVNPEAWAGVVV
jgi:Spx/MgsR family transcriptional regulator